jgi:hypothetical protein
VQKLFDPLAPDRPSWGSSRRARAGLRGSRLIDLLSGRTEIPVVQLENAAEPDHARIHREPHPELTIGPSTGLVERTPRAQ